MALTDEEQAALEVKHKAEIDALNAKITEVSGGAAKVEALEAKIKELESRSGGDGAAADWAREEIRKISAQRDDAKKALADAQAATESAKAKYEAQQLALRKEYAVKAAMQEAGVLPSMQEFAMQKLDLASMELDESGKLTAKIGDETKSAVEAVVGLKESLPQFFGDSQPSGSLAGSTSGGNNGMSIKDKDGNIDNKRVIERGINAFADKL